jgi:hypothetical protein
MNHCFEITKQLQSNSELESFLRSLRVTVYDSNNSQNEEGDDFSFQNTLISEDFSTYIVERGDGGIKGLSKINYCQFDTDIFGLRMGRISYLLSNNPNPVEMISAVCEYLRKEQYKFVDVSLDSIKGYWVPAFENSGFKFTGTNVTLLLSLGDLSNSHSTPPSIREFKSTDIPYLGDLSAESFSNPVRNLNRFILDGNFPLTKIGDLYKNWFLNCASGERAQKVFTAEVDNRPVGFIACNIVYDTASNIKTGDVPLNAVSSDYARKGLYRALVYKAMDWFLSEGCDFAEIKTQVSTFAPQRVWLQMGGAPIKYEFNFHKWLS